MREGYTYRHKNCLDVDMYVEGILASEPEYQKLEVIWINRHWKNVRHRDEVVVKRADLGNWSVI